MKKKLESTPEKTQLGFFINHSFTGATQGGLYDYLKDHGEAKSAEQQPTERVLFFTHIPKCAGKGIQTIFKSLGYNEQRICVGGCPPCGHKNNTKENYINSQLGNFKDTDIVLDREHCNKIIKKINTDSNTYNYIGHHVFPRKKTKNDIIITSIRNPYDLIVSRWCYHIRMLRVRARRSGRPPPTTLPTFEEWIDEYSGETLMRFYENCYEDGDCHKNMIIDYFIKMENIEEGINDLIKLGYIKTNKSSEEIKIICWVKQNVTNRTHYTNYYNDDLKRKVYNSAKPIFDMFGYDF